MPILKKVIPYTDYDGNPATKEAYFSLSRKECIDMNLDYEKEGGLVGRLKSLMADTIDGKPPQKPAIDFVSMLVERAYGIRPKEDPSLFLKEDEEGHSYGKRFKQSLAYDAYVYGLLTGEYSLEEFATNVLPRLSPEQEKDVENNPDVKELKELIGA